MGKKILFIVILCSSISSCNLTYMNNAVNNNNFDISSSNKNKEEALILELNNKHVKIDKIIKIPPSKDGGVDFFD